jgi:hypothetical protein
MGECNTLNRHERELEGRQRYAQAEGVPGRRGAANAIKPTGCPASTAMRYAGARTASHQ